MTPSRVLRLGAAALLSMILSAGLTSVASAADPTDPMSGSTSSAPVAATRVNGSTTPKARAAHLAASGAASPAIGGSAISGTVTQKGGGAIAGAYVWAGSTTSDAQYDTTTAANGTYSLAVPADSYLVWFDDNDGTHFNGYYSGGGVPVDKDHATVVTVTTGNVTGINAQLQLEAPWTISIQATASSAAIGSNVRITATANQEVALTDYYILIYRSDSSAPSWFCSSGSTCYVDDSRSSAGPWTYYATVAYYNGTFARATSAQLTVNWVVPATYHAMAPGRLLDTRDGTGGLSGPFTNHVARTFQVTGGTSGVPAGATAVTGNLTVTGQTSKGYLFIGPDPKNDPTSSTLNFPVGDDRANGVTVALSGTGSLSITFVAPSDGPSADAIFDVTGYFTADPMGARYVALSPKRLLDTRDGTGGLSSPSANHEARTFSSGSGVPAGAIAVTGNLTVTGQTSKGYLFIGPDPMNDPTSSTLNFPVGDDRANGVTVALSATGSLSITFVAPSNGPNAQAIFDVTGYFVRDSI